MIKHITSIDARLWTFINKIFILETYQNHSKLWKTMYQMMPDYKDSEEQNLYDGSLSKSFQNHQTHYIKWCQIMAIQEQDLYGRNLLKLQ